MPTEPESDGEQENDREAAPKLALRGIGRLRVPVGYLLQIRL
jgi:hypothetical protein